MKSISLRRVTPEQLFEKLQGPVNATALSQAREIVEDVRRGGEVALRRHSERLGDTLPGASILIGKAELDLALGRLDPEDRACLERTAARIRYFAKEQLACLAPLDLAIEGGRAGHRWIPAKCVGAYAPGGRYPLPSSVLMTGIPARVAGVETVLVASPRPTELTLAAAALAGADGLLAVGGAQAIAALAFGVLGPAADLVVGPGNRWVTAAKKHLVGEIGIDALAGPSELVVIADASAPANLIAADLIAQAEHDVDARPILIATDSAIADSVEREIAIQLEDLSTGSIARQALELNGRIVLVGELHEAVSVSDRVAPEHLQLCVEDPRALAELAQAYGAIFIGSRSAEVFGDYGAGPNHVLPTGGSARFQAGLSVYTFLRAATFLDLDDWTPLAPDSARLARLEGLEGHARATQRISRRPSQGKEQGTGSSPEN